MYARRMIVSHSDLKLSPDPIGELLLLLSGLNDEQHCQTAVSAGYKATGVLIV